MLFGLFSRKRALELAAASDDDKHPSPPCEPPLTPSPPPDAPDVASLRAYVLSIPPQTLHTYTASRLHSDLDPATIHHLAAFFAELSPPPKLHCVRCHKAFFEIENTDRSCLVAHDDESAEVERVSAKSKDKGTLYETTWSCCGKTVEGDGDMGPPDGWCYEGQHTTDTKRARFRADSTMHDDKLVSCERLRCGMPPRSTRKRGRPVAEDEDEHSSATSSHPSTNASPRSSNGRKKARTRAPPPPLEESNQMDIVHDNDNDVTCPSPGPAPSSPKPNLKLRAKPKPKPKPKSKPASATTTVPKTSSPLVLVPPFVSRPSSPDANKVQVVITSSSASASPARSRKNSGVSVGKGRGSIKARAKGKARPLEEVVDSSVDAERAMGT